MIYAIHKKLGTIQELPDHSAGWINKFEWEMFTEFPTKENYFSIVSSQLEPPVSWKFGGQTYNGLLKIAGQLLKMVKASEWETRHAAENKYCPYCANDNDMWIDQTEHHKGCKFVMVVKKAEKMIAKFSS